MPVARQAGSKDPVRCGVVETGRKTEIQKISGHTRDTADGGVRKCALAEGNTRKPAVLGIVPVRQGRRPLKVANPGGAESVQAGVVLSSKTPVKATDRRGIRERNLMAKDSVRSVPSL